LVVCLLLLTLLPTTSNPKDREQAYGSHGEGGKDKVSVSHDVFLMAKVLYLFQITLFIYLNIVNLAYIWFEFRSWWYE